MDNRPSSDSRNYRNKPKIKFKFSNLEKTRASALSEALRVGLLLQVKHGAGTKELKKACKDWTDKAGYPQLLGEHYSDLLASLANSAIISKETGQTTWV